MLEEILSDLPPAFADPALLVGRETNDDAAVYLIDEDKAVVATTDFFMPVVDDPFDFGRIAAANALSDIYAVGARPLFALALVGMPVDKLGAATVSRILSGGVDICGAAGIAVGGGHSIDSPEPIYGLAVVGLIDPALIKRNNTARPGDVLILGKGLGVGILCAALKADKLDPGAYSEIIETATRLNDIGMELAERDAVHAMTDVTGFGLIGHLMEICRGSGLGASIELDALPILRSAPGLARAGFNTGAGTRNRETWQDRVSLPDGLAEWRRNLLYDPQTSGGLILTVEADAAEDLLGLFHGRDYADARIIGQLEPGEAHITVR